jgi:hypothetical protein
MAFYILSGLEITRRDCSFQNKEEKGPKNPQKE